MKGKETMTGYKYCILGGGMVAGYAAKELTSQGVKPGELAIISADDAPSYERPPLSKGFLAGKEAEASLFINDDAFYRSHGMALRLRRPVASVDAQQQQLRTQEGETIAYESLLVATGSRVRTLDLPGAGIGADPVTEPLRESAAQIEHGVVTNAYLETGLPQVWAAGVVASYRDVLYDKQRRVEHWDNAIHSCTCRTSSRMSSISHMSCGGDAEAAERVVYRGELRSGSFSA
jgi:NAD(P)H-nitrite reductase large subunit